MGFLSPVPLQTKLLFKNVKQTKSYTHEDLVEPIYSKWKKYYYLLKSLTFSMVRQKKPLVSGIADDEKNLHPGGRKSRFLINFPDILSFFSLVYFAFFIFLLFLLVCFLKLKIYILIHFRLCGRVSDKNIFTRSIPRKTTFFWLYMYFLFRRFCWIYWTSRICRQFKSRLCSSDLCLTNNQQGN